MKQIKIIFILIGIILLSSFVSADYNVTDNHGQTLTNLGSYSSWWGMRFSTYNATNIQLLNVTLATGCGCDVVRILYSGNCTQIGTDVFTSSYVANFVNQSIYLSNNTNYTVECRKNSGGTYSLYYKGSAGLPITNSQIRWTIGTKECTNDYLNQINNIQSIGLSVPSIVPNVTTVSRYSQDPSDITSTNLFSYPNVNITYNITTSSGYIDTSNINLFYTVNSSTGCWIYTNETGTSCGILNKTYTDNTSSLFRFTLGTETNIYPATYNFNQSEMVSTSKSSNTQSGTNNYFALTFKNISSSKSYSFFESYLNATVIGNSIQSALIYYCNSSYDFNSIASTNSNCYNFNSILPSIQFNHTHGINSYHILEPLTISNGNIGTVKVTSTSYILIKVNSNSNTWSQRYITNISYTDQFRTSNNGGTTWSSVTGTADAHIHQYDGTQALIYYVGANSTVNSTIIYSSNYTDDLNLSLLGITAPIITYPSGDVNVSRLLNITWQNSTGLSSTNFTYNISLMNNDGTYNSTILNSTSNNYYQFDATNVPFGVYRIRVYAIDNLNQTNYYISDNFTKYAYLNITAISGVTSLPITNFSIYKNGTLDGNTTTGEYYLEYLELQDYNITIDATGYSIENAVVTITDPYEEYQFSLYGNNSLRITIRDEQTGGLVLQNVSIQFTYSGGEFTNVTNTSEFYIENLNAETYQLLFTSSTPIAYSPRTYVVTIGNRTSTTLSAFLLRNISTTTFFIFNPNSYPSAEPLINVSATMYKTINGTWQVVESKFTDITGRCQFSYDALTNYKFYLSVNGYTDKVFYLNPILFSSYDIPMTALEVNNQSNDYDAVSIIYAPSSVYADTLTPFTMLFQSPSGRLVSYGFTIYGTDDNSTASGLNAVGGQLTGTINTSNANVNDFVSLRYYYYDSVGGLKNFSATIPIIFNSTTAQTFQSGDKTFGLGLFERVLIITIISIIIMGIGMLIGSPIAGLLIALFTNFFFIYMKFIPAGIFIISFIIGFIIIVSRTERQ